MFGALAAPVLAATGFGKPPTPQQALKHAKSVALVMRGVKDDRVHSYLKEVWRLDPNAAGAPPPIGSEDGDPIPYDSRMQHLNGDWIIFNFGENRPKELPVRWGSQVMEDGMAHPFQMDVPDAQTAVKKTKPKASRGSCRAEPSEFLAAGARHQTPVARSLA